MSISQLFPMFVLAAVVGAVIGVLTAIEILKRALPQLIPSPLEVISVDQIKVVCEIKRMDGSIAMQHQISTTYQDLSAVMVEQWLEKRGLVMSPKGQDFTVKAPS